ncbi:MAG: ACP S-malonyltransferase [Planctomycetes bacterium]|nr:ACP S-malonyltransferase [Planctomycetota bacterium]
MDAKQLKARLPATAFAFRGYNVTNLGRSAELLEHPQYGPVVEEHLAAASELATRVMGQTGEVRRSFAMSLLPARFARRPPVRSIDLVSRVRNREETTLDSYADAVALIVAMELAQIELLRRFFDVELAEAKLQFGFSLGEIAANIAGGVLSLEAIRVPLSLADDCVRLAQDLTLGVVFCRRKPLPMEHVRRLCVRVNQEGRGIIGVSAVLSPNSVLVMGQQDTLDRLKAELDKVADDRVFLRKNEHPWPPLHTPIVWEKAIPNRAAMLMLTLDGGTTPPKPPIVSLVTGKTSYNDYNARDLLHRWTDHPQLLWDAVYETLSQGVEVVVHAGPTPNIIPATFNRLRENVEAQMKASLGLRAMSGIVTRPWLKSLAPTRTALLRAPLVQHVILEDWLLENAPE